METTTKQTGLEIDAANQNGNTLAILGTVTKTLKRNGFSDAAKEVANRVFAAGSSDEALAIMQEYVVFSFSMHLDDEEFEDTDNEEDEW